MSLDSLLRWIAERFGRGGYFKVEGEFAMDWQKLLQKAMENLEDINIGIVLEGFEIAANDGYEAAVHYVVLAHNAQAGADAAGVSLEEAKKVIKGAVLQLH